MRSALHIVFALGAALAAANAHAYCVRNALADRPVHAAVIPSRAPTPPKLFNESVAAGKEFCCNPKNADCNPDRVPDDGSVAFEARVETATAPIPCGQPDPKAPTRARAVAPVRGFLRFELNTHFDVRRPPAPDNPPFFLRALTPDSKVVATYTCPPQALSGTPRG